MKGKYLITTDAWFLAPDGKSYRAVWGEVEIVEDSFLGIKTNRNASNWFARVGGKDNHVIVAGCQIHYAVRCEDCPNTEKVTDYQTEDGFNEFERPTQIYIAS
ncbi:hypothetical protein [Salmonirosea aquatica]|uniref:Uncharacterized protein n=1 Tax=Salmonirosea aquatica TaxID=2654236 RepID=A0A7C9BIA0_9BACT|nr:hypothetical protein [Cytophagaceae bacterium SJW1-29]